MKFIKTPLPDVLIIEPDVFNDDRGFFMETWHYREFTEAGLDTQFVQDNHSRSVRNTLRGLHYQIEHPQGKLVRVIEGEVFDVVVDLRKSSPGFGQWFGHVLSEANKLQLWCPPGFAHGFLVLSDTSQICYKCSDYYAPEYERSLRWDDPGIAIDWPLPAGAKPILSDKDRQGTSLQQAEVYD